MRRCDSSFCQSPIHIPASFLPDASISFDLIGIIEYQEKEESLSRYYLSHFVVFCVIHVIILLPLDRW